MSDWTHTATLRGEPVRCRKYKQKDPTSNAHYFLHMWEVEDVQGLVDIDRLKDRTPIDVAIEDSGISSFAKITSGIVVGGFTVQNEDRYSELCLYTTAEETIKDVHTPLVLDTLAFGPDYDVRGRLADGRIVVFEDGRGMLGPDRYVRTKRRESIDGVELLVYLLGQTMGDAIRDALLAAVGV